MSQHQQSKLIALLFLGYCFLLNITAHSEPIPVPSARITEVNAAAQNNGFPGSQYPYWSSTNDCGDDSWYWPLIPNGYYPLGNTFKNACNQHDRCYMTLGRNQKKCDDDFYKAMRTKCDTYTWRDLVTLGLSVPFCHAGAGVFYGAVKSAGEPVFKNSQQKQAAYEVWLQSYMKESH